MIDFFVIGTLYKPIAMTGFEKIDDPLPDAEKLEGWHVNATEEVLEWEKYKISPSNKAFIFSDANTHCYSWPDEKSWLEAYNALDKSYFLEKPKVPTQINRRQAKLALLDAKLLTKAEAVLDALPEPMRTAAMIDWADAPTFNMDDPLLKQMAIALGLTDQELIDLFIKGSAI